jgi:hypothetical protein
MEDLLNRIFENLIDRVSGPMKFRLILQPLMAIIFAVRSGLKDAKEGKPAYFWGLFTEPDKRRDMLRDGWKSIGKVFIIALILDIVYQYIALRWFYPFEALVVAIILAIIPYILVRGPVNRVLSRTKKENIHE